jgi:hypothetical protein
MAVSTGRVLLFSSLLLFVIGCSRALEVACQCTTFTNEFVFTNNKNTVQHYSIQKSGLASSWTTLTPFTFTLSPGQSETIVAFTKVPCNAQERLYDLIVKAVSENDLISKSIEFSVSSCHSVMISHQGSYDACVNDQTVIPLTIANDGDYVEEVNLSSSIGELSTSSMILGIDESRELSLIIETRELGVYPARITVISSEGESLFYFNINSIECASFTASLSQDYVNLCEDEEAQVLLTINNQGSAKDFYLSSTYFLDLPESVHLSANQVYTEPINVYSGCDSKVIKPSIRVWADGALSTELPLVVNVKGCYQPILIPKKESGAVCACEEVAQTFTLFNPGSKQVTYALNPSVGSVYYQGARIDNLVLGPDQTADLIVKHNVPCSYRGALSMSLNATSVSTCSKSAVSDVELIVSSLNICQAVNLGAPVSVPVTNTSTITVPVTVRNMGLRETSYDVVVGGSAMTNLLSISKSFLTLSPGDNEVVELVFDSSGITGSYVNVQVISSDELSSDSKVINFGSFFLGEFEIYYLFIPGAVVVLIVILLLRRKFFNKSKTSIVNED